MPCSAYYAMQCTTVKTTASFSVECVSTRTAASHLLVFLAKVDCNILVVDWSSGARKPHYLAAAANTALVGRQVFVLVRNLLRKFARTVTPERVHVIGFSLGAHVGGFFGRIFTKRTGRRIARITGNVTHLTFPHSYALKKRMQDDVSLIPLFRV